MTLQLWGNTVLDTLSGAWAGVAVIVPVILAAIIVFIIGWIVAMILGKVVLKVVQAVKIDALLRGTEVERMVNKAGFHLDVAAFLAGLVKWFFIVVALVAAFDILGLVEINNFLVSVLLYIPNVVIAVIILLVGAVVSEVLKRIVTGSTKAAGAHSAHLLGSVTKWAIWIFALLAALDQLHIASDFIGTLFTGVVVALSLAFGLAFGLGGQQAASETIAKIRSEITSK